MAKFKLPVIVKDKNANMAIYAGIALLIGFLIYKNWSKIKAFLKLDKETTFTAEDETSAKNPTTGGSNTSSTQVGCTNETVLKRGSKCDRVQWIQYYFNTKVLSKVTGTRLVEDGVFGEKTELAVKQITGSTKTTWTNFKSKVDQKYS